jgi:hypothetical protein
MCILHFLYVELNFDIIMGCAPFGATGHLVVIKIKRDAQGKGLSLLGFSFTGHKVFVGRPGYRIDSRTIKRGFRSGNLITSS